MATINTLCVILTRKKKLVETLYIISNFFAKHFVYQDRCLWNLQAEQPQLRLFFLGKVFQPSQIISAGLL